MKITDWAIIFILIVTPFLWLSSIHAEDVREINRLETKYSAALKTAAQDGGTAMNVNEHQQYESGYGSNKFMRVDKEQALDALLNSLYLNLGIPDDFLSQQALLVYIPAIVVMDYDGYYVYSADEYKGEDGSEQISHRWRPKKPYVYLDQQGNSVSFTMDQYVTAYDHSRNRWISGLKNEIKSDASIPLLHNDQQFDEVRRSVIVRSIEEDLAQVISHHNEVAPRWGVHYTFTLPTIPQEAWTNTINDVGILLFLQGIPIGDQYYNNFAFGGGRLVKSKPVLGGVDMARQRKLYYRSPCQIVESLSFQVEEVFANEKEAAAQGYFPLQCN